MMPPPVFELYAAFELFNTDHGKVTCVGYAPSKHRRCQNSVQAKSSRSLQTRLQRLLDEDPFSDEVETVLRDLAAGSLCKRDHQNQADTIFSNWIQNVQDHRASARSVSAAQAAPRRIPAVNRTRSSTVHRTAISIANPTRPSTGNRPISSIVNRTRTSTVNRTETTNPTATAATTIRTTPRATRSTRSTRSNPTPALARVCETAHVPRRSTDDDCAICLEECRNTPLSQLVWCKASCGRSLHSACFREWRTQRAYDTPLTCVFW
jgi:hypothetical protein